MKCPNCNNSFNDDSLFQSPSGEMLCAKCLNALWRSNQEAIAEEEDGKRAWIDTWGNVPESPALLTCEENLKELHADRDLIEEVLEENNIAESDVHAAIEDRRAEEDFDESEYTGGESFEDFSGHENLDN